MNNKIAFKNNNSLSLSIIKYSLLIIHLHSNLYGGVAQLARAPALQAGGQEFDSPHLHQMRSERLEVRNENFRK